ncbi:hypothetical protein [Mycolicibacterium fortuitum]|uniref:Uncharacterized protein n=1 Tax=Mycolicibacterium fortuitum TaxID=1766 RepID=A0AAE4VFT4_MYCFO|nr:hypothetical protein [Mycolicibacterium fortuitum]MCV7137713.1 hypothetical protein [Mycolicibacterium fortuitum]MDV7193266.1 hypothetical protein [Mycolicibacterium fortuitum]MDV7206054.1 hypothetical protein [Mycolicibacterium fortuitum]MDV7227466.1 hypothetical protein [Mycolicibacterium fortuitum]MDV7259836.1 hypothetical protein [Mycolicibacterium fortuitum]
MTELAGWDPAPIAAALELIASGTRERCQIVFDFGSAGTVSITLDLDFDSLTRETTDGLLAQLAELSLLAARSRTTKLGCAVMPGLLPGSGTA